ncbi:MAG: alanine racemase [Flavobacteriales bacterium]|nr:alanine racemase [Flavobacteriales bacterium]
MGRRSTCSILERARSNMRDLAMAFRAIHPRTSIGHSYKTNYIPALCELTYAEGAYAEVVSGMEYDLALRLKAAPQRILLNGPVKSAQLLERALLAGSLVNVDSLQEVEVVRTIAQRYADHTLRVGLRVNFALDGLKRSRFGIDAEGEELTTAYSRLTEGGNIAVEGLHGHFGGDRSAASYRDRTTRMVALADRLFGTTPPKFIDVGGGLAGRMPDALRAQFKKPPPTYAEYAAAIATPMHERYGTGPDAPELIVEPGMGLFSDVLEFICRVAATKTIGGSRHAIVTGSIYNVKPTLNAFDLPMEVVPTERTTAPSATWVVSGYTCMEIDILHSGVHADLAVGDHVVFANTGAYTVVLKPPFIDTAPAILAVDTDGAISIARRAETLDDLMTTYPIA